MRITYDNPRAPGKETIKISVRKHCIFISSSQFIIKRTFHSLRVEKMTIPHPPHTQKKAENFVFHYWNGVVSMVKILLDVPIFTLSGPELLLNT